MDSKVEFLVPERPWQRGVHPDYQCFFIRVLVAETQGSVFSDQEPETPGDVHIAEKWASGGLRQSSYALMTEALRKESLYTVLLKIQNDPTYFEKYVRGGEKSKLEMEKEIATAVSQAVVDNLRTNATSLVRECLENIALSSVATKGQ